MVITQKTSPFLLNNKDEYSIWRDEKLKHAPISVDQMLVEVKDACNLSEFERAKAISIVTKTNMVVVANHAKDQSWGSDCLDDKVQKTSLKLAQQFGLIHLDHNLCAEDAGLTLLRVNHEEPNNRYIPYTDKPIRWHTDGYYNPKDRQIKGMVLACARPAIGGGVNQLMDCDMAYIALREKNPDYIDALFHPNAMTIPANIVEGVIVRAQETGPVFSIDQSTGQLHMRYTARTRSIEWRNDACTNQAVEALSTILNSPAGTGYPKYEYKLEAGQALLCNNVLHNRSKFSDAEIPASPESRLLCRGRFLDRIDIS